MKITEMNKILKDMKAICPFKDSETEICVRSKEVDPVSYTEKVCLRTVINGISVYMDKFIDNKGE